MVDELIVSQPKSTRIWPRCPRCPIEIDGGSKTVVAQPYNHHPCQFIIAATLCVFSG
jgi:hypothetical protein